MWFHISKGICGLIRPHQREDVLALRRSGPLCLRYAGENTVVSLRTSQVN